MTYKVVRKYKGAIVGREVTGEKKEGYKGLSYTFECNGNGCDEITLSQRLIDNLPEYFARIDEDK
jgi:hypothetical protein